MPFYAPGILYVVSTPIGHKDDITLRAIEILRACDIILCEDLKPARRLLSTLKIEKELLPLNEHTTKEATEEALELLRQGKNLALMSDAGTPLIADPGNELVKMAINEGITVSPIPGASSIMAALVVCGFPLTSFTFVGFLPREKSERLNAARDLRSRTETLVLLEAPYRLPQLLDDLERGIGPDREAAICMDLTLPKERVRRDTLLGLKEYFAEHPFKGEFVVVIRGAKRTSTQHKAGGATRKRR